MAAGETHGLGYHRVDQDPNVDVLLGTMDVTGGWEATVQLRDWERSRFGLSAGWRLLDVGCGQGDVVITLSQDLGLEGEIVGVDVSAEMVAAARRRAKAATCRFRFEVGDAESLLCRDGYFDAVRSERTLQWVPNPEAAVAEMRRVLRVGGRLSLIDTDWSTLSIDVGDDDIGRRVGDALRTERRRPSNVGARLAGLVRVAGLEVLGETSATQVWHSWDPDRDPAPAGCFSMASLAADLVEAGQLEPGQQDQFVSSIHRAARRGAFRMALTMHAVMAEVPSG